MEMFKQVRSNSLTDNSALSRACESTLENCIVTSAIHLFNHWIGNDKSM